MSGPGEDGRMWVTNEIVDDGQVDLFGGHLRGLGSEREGGMRRGSLKFTKGIIYRDVIGYSHGFFLIRAC